MVLVDNVMYLKLYPKQYPVWCPNQKKTKFVDIPDRGWNTFKKQSKEMSKPEAIPDVFSCSGGVPRVFLSWWEFLASFVLVGVPGVSYMFLEFSKPTFNSGDSSHYRQLARAVNTGV